MYDPFSAARNAANQVGDPATFNYNWLVQDFNKSASKQMDFTGDHNSNDKMRLSGRFSYESNNGNPASLFGEGTPVYAFGNGKTGTKTKSIVTGFTRTQNATTVWTLRYGPVYSDFYRNSKAPAGLWAG